MRWRAWLWDVVQLPCEVDRASCGDFHSIKWYKDSDRVYIFSDMANVRRAEGPLLERTDFHYAANGTDSSLEIKPLQIEDEGTYKCEITYLAVQEACSVVQFVNLTTYGEYTAAVEEDGSGLGRNVLRLPVSRHHLDSTLVCEAVNPAITAPFIAFVTLDVNDAPIVRVTPENITVNESMDILIFCQYSANPLQLTHVNWFQDKRLVDVAGNPEKYGNGDVEHPTLLIKNSSANDMGNYTCRVSNEVGVSDVVNTASVSVLSAPSFIERLQPYHGAVMNSAEVSLSCRVECSPLCNVSWLKDDQPLLNQSHYEIASRVMPADPNSGWRMGNETLTQDVTSEGLESRLRLPATSDSLATYSCFVNNTIGESIACEIDVTALDTPNTCRLLRLCAYV
ncbi:hypothetical protein Pcinc_040738 [Petrolisthes cinctipes]|uniref:Ig-like domain-containing protein n=1 Tax=Petrolisthes cinctipes TaxID=88211 RepID=A0AAE1BPQ5_PETCI|nr:hypothetical protein Pcinc_040738 [Petrolisthes cinctipes]